MIRLCLRVILSQPAVILMPILMLMLMIMLLRMIRRMIMSAMGGVFAW